MEIVHTHEIKTRSEDKYDQDVWKSKPIVELEHKNLNFMMQDMNTNIGEYMKN